MRSLVAMPPSPRYVGVAGAALTVVAAGAASVRVSPLEGQPGVYFGQFLLLNLVAVAFMVAALYAALLLVPHRLYVQGPKARALAVSYGVYVVAGIAGGLAHVGMEMALYPFGGSEPLWHILSDVALSAAVALGLGFLANRYNAAQHRIRAQENALQEQMQRLRHSQQLIGSADERLRRNVAELLHGRVQTRLVIAWHKLGECERLVTSDPARAKSLLAEVREQIDVVREQDVRQASHLLHPSIVRVGLMPAVRSLADRFGESLRVSLLVDPVLARLDDPAENRIPERVRLVAYRVLEEAFTNIYRHAKARAVDVSLWQGPDDNLHMQVRDNGQGFDTSHLRPGLGLITIEARVVQVGGTWRISSVPGYGTEMSIVLPLNGAHPASRPATTGARSEPGVEALPRVPLPVTSAGRG